MAKKKTNKAAVKTSKSKKKKAQSSLSFWLNIGGMAVVIVALFCLINVVINKKPEKQIEQKRPPTETNAAQNHSGSSQKSERKTSAESPKQSKEEIIPEKPKPLEEDLVLKLVKELSESISVDAGRIRKEKKDNEVKFFIPIPDQNEDLYFCNMFYKGRMEKEGFEMKEGVETFFYQKRVKINAQKLTFVKQGLKNSYSLILYFDTRSKQKTKIAVVINFDKNVSDAMTTKLSKMSRSLHPAYLPEKKIASDHFQKAQEAGFPCIIRIPMEPIGSYPYKAGKNSILVSDSPRKVNARLKSFVSLLPGAVGITNYMGSHATAKREIMEPVMDYLKETGLFFFDSVTTDKSCAGQVAAEKNILFFSKDNQLDGKIDNSSKRLQIIDALSKTKAGFIVYEYNCNTLQDLENLDSFVKLAETNGFSVQPLNALRTLQIPKL